MQNESTSANAEKSVVSTRTMEIVVSIAFLLVGALVLWDSVRLGHRWSDEGPQAGYFPFYIAVIMMAAAALNLFFTGFSKKARQSGAKTFVTWGQLKPVLAVLFPLILFLFGMQFLGLYLSAALFIGIFMRINGGYGLTKILPIAIITPVVVYLMFEKWFLVPLPKGPIEAMLGL